MNKKTGIGIIGAWGLRRGLIRYVAQNEDVNLLGAADISAQALENFQKEYGKNLYVTQDYRDLLRKDDIDAVFILSPDYCHEEHAVAALQAGKAVYLEKPLAITIDGALNILQTAKQTSSLLYVGHNMRYFPVVLKMKEIIESGVIGEVQVVWCRHFISYGGDAYFKDWHSQQKNVTGLLLQKAAHDIDVIHWLANSHSTMVTAMGKLSVYNRCTNKQAEGETHVVSFNQENWPPLEDHSFAQKIDVEDHSMMLMSMQNGVQASYMQCHYTPDAWRNYTVIGTKGRVENIGDSGDCSIKLYTSRTDTFEKPDTVYFLHKTEGSHGGSDPSIVKSFVDFVRTGRKANIDPSAAFYAVAAGIAATESLRNNSQPEQVQTLPEELTNYFTNGQRPE
ncbi:Gfo/Idh/MocA family protein [Treponema phagedenis]|uniref:Gfo/Idh/MocA family oxidoreductase n=1 Tax=Treponema phagedenis TaxID=162 RepID=A0AAE6IW30_TREPH|nr:Gfo/Idh/MocA family oxidoreductase [Treponema phagedenis]NVP24006.1 Gfo/Idh/MocA family oxidoreductase [Treponema phagedenis]QEJ99425.1 Gfo/Idh/MocA family oxidoreductase [Treponema phagedenis]QEJ99794.1 Gfo/Idh/MocA family oxidoreductase [Treponema phagedenis]QEK04996.1 Gfo/Idh/MocA family oxidoreductase [Treponema phagedenis]QEK07277.1 Gfo/Idh/MocA family oxidoreductase [Treponema phagedenis]